MSVVDPSGVIIHQAVHVVPFILIELPPVPRVGTTPDVPAIPSVPKNTPVSQVSHAPCLAMPPPPSVSVSWT